MDQEKKWEETAFICGKNAVLETLRSELSVDTLYIDEKDRSPAMMRIRAIARDRGAVVKEVRRDKLDAMSRHAEHQGVAALCAGKAYVSVEDILQKARLRGEPPFVLILDKIEDPHNYGAILRTAECAGVHGVVVAKRHAAPLSQAVFKTSAGAAAYVDIARVANLAAAITYLKEQGVWVYGADMDGTAVTQTDLSGPLALVIGAEGEGLSHLVKERCDGVVSIEMFGRVNSLNASVAAAVVVYEAVRQRGIKKR